MTRITGIPLRRRVRHLGRIVRRSAFTPSFGASHKPILAAGGELALTFIGHAGFFAQVGGKNILIDPNFARWLFVIKRLRRPGTKLTDLPAIDYVLITHAHFDHLDRSALRRIARMTRRKAERRPTILVPQQVGDLVRGLGFSAVVEMRWWQERREGGLEITHTPARHWGARMLRDSQRGYGGYVIRAGAHSLYHAGDSAYFGGFREIGERLRPQLALLPIGAYSPPAFRNNHCSPEDAVRAFQDLGARYLVPMHYGSFRLSQEPFDEPPLRLRQAAYAAGIGERVLLLEEGRTKIFG